MMSQGNINKFSKLGLRTKFWAGNATLPKSKGNKTDNNNLLISN